MSDLAPATIAALALVSSIGCRPDPGDATESSTSTDDTGESSTDTTDIGETGTETETETETETATETGTETGEPEPVCGDGTLDPGEACDDANTDETDGCTSACELGPCGFAWVTRELVFTGVDLEPFTPLVADGRDLVVAHQLGDGGEQTGLVRAGRADGVVYASAEPSFGPGGPEAHALAVGPGGELFLARANIPAGQVEIHRLSFDGAIEWTASRASVAVVPELALAATGELVLTHTVDAGPMSDDVELVGLDPADGAQLWAHAFGGPPAPNGFSSDRAAALALDDAGRAFVAYDRYLDWDTLAPTVVGFDPGGAPDPVWTTVVTQMPGHKLEVGDLALGPDATLGLVFQRWDGSQKFWVATLDAETGEVGWIVERDDFDLPDTLSSARAVAVTRDRVLATGTWIADIDGLDVYQGYVLGLSPLDGSLVCLGTLDDHEPGINTTSESWLPFALLTSGSETYLAGYVNTYTTGRVDLLLARVL